MGIFSLDDIEILFPGLDRRRLYEWQLKHYIVKLRNEWYCLPDFLKESYSTWIIANLVHKPSYISLESALSYFNVIPEGVFMTTSVTTNRTHNIAMAGSEYGYSSLKQDLFFGYKLLKIEKYDRHIKIAEVEKALIDFFYIHPNYRTEEEIRQLRFNELELTGEIDKEKLFRYLDIYKKKELENRINTMLNIYLNA
ncbi:MAG: hypothetical protein ABFS38_12000 [Bacteroidota bacterium]